MHKSRRLLGGVIKEKLPIHQATPVAEGDRGLIIRLYGSITREYVEDWHPGTSSPRRS
jgi:hypothetical protein